MVPTEVSQELKHCFIPNRLNLNGIQKTGRDKTVRRECSAIFSGKKVVLEETERVASPYGGLSVFVEFLNRIGYLEAVRRHMPVCLTSPNAIAPMKPSVESSSGAPV